MAEQRQQITAEMAGARRARIVASFDEAENLVRSRYPSAHREGACGGWSWTVGEQIVAASNFVEAPPHGRHWLAIRGEDNG